MNIMPKLIVMLTRNDKTVHNAYEIFDQCKHTKAEIWGLKEAPLLHEEMKRIYAYMKECGKITALEAVTYTEEESVKSAQLAADCGCDIFMGTVYSDSVNAICKANSMKYMPFVGQVSNRPSILEGTAEQMIAEANADLDRGAHGIDLLGYRYTGDAQRLIKELVSNVHGTVCIAGSIDSYQKLDEVIGARADMFTIGSAFFEHRFGNDFSEQINQVCDYVEKQVCKRLVQRTSL